MSEVGRSPWGEDSSSAQQQAPQGLPIRLFFMFLVGLVPAIAVMLFLNTINFTIDPVPTQDLKVSDPAFAAQLTTNIRLTRWAIVGAIASATQMAILASFMATLSHSRRGRGFLVGAFFVLIGILLATVVTIVMGQLVPYSRPGERLILPGLLITFFGILAFFSPSMPIWRVNVPDNQVWMILDRNDHLVSYIGPGVRMIRPVEGFGKYEQSGALIIKIDDETFASHDYFPYRVRVNVVCLFNPLNAEPYMWVPLRDMKKETIEAGLKTEIEFLIRHRVSNYLREYLQERMRLDEVLNTLAMDIKEAVEKRKHMGIRLAPLNGLNVILDPPEVILNSRQRRMSVEALASGEQLPNTKALRDLLQLVSLDGDLKMNITPEGQINFALNPGNDIEIGASLEKAIMGAVRYVGAATARARRHDQLLQDLSAESQYQLSATNPADTQPVEPPAATEHSQPTHPASPPHEGAEAGTPDSTRIHIAPEPPEPPKPQKPPENDDVIETDVNEKGVFIPRNPIIPGPTRKD